MKERHRDIFEFFSKERHKLVNYIRRKMQSFSEMDSEDILQDVMLNFFKKADVSRPVENLTAYIYSSINNKIIDHSRKRKNTVSIDSTMGDEDTTLLDMLSDEEDVYLKVEKKEDYRRLLKAMDELDPRQRAVLIATEVEGYSFKELSIMWDEPVGTLLSRKSRAIQALQKTLKSEN